MFFQRLFSSLQIKLFYAFSTLSSFKTTLARCVSYPRNPQESHKLIYCSYIYLHFSISVDEENFNARERSSHVLLGGSDSRRAHSNAFLMPSDSQKEHKLLNFVVFLITMHLHVNFTDFNGSSKAFFFKDIYNSCQS